VTAISTVSLESLLTKTGVASSHSCWLRGVKMGEVLTDRTRDCRKILKHPVTEQQFVIRIDKLEKFG